MIAIHKIMKIFLTKITMEMTNDKKFLCFVNILRVGLPYISLVDVMDPWMARAPWMPSHVPHGLLDFSEKMSFMQRLGNMVFNIMWITLPPLLFDIPVEEDVLKFYADDIPNFTSVNGLVAESELWLITTNEYIDYVKPMMANMVIIC